MNWVNSLVKGAYAVGAVAATAAVTYGVKVLGEYAGWWGPLTESKCLIKIDQHAQQSTKRLDTTARQNQLQLLEQVGKAIPPILKMISEQRIEDLSVREEMLRECDQLILRLQTQARKNRTSRPKTEVEIPGELSLFAAIDRLTALRDRLARERGDLAGNSRAAVLTVQFQDALGQLSIDGKGVSEEELLPILRHFNDGLSSISRNASHIPEARGSQGPIGRFFDKCTGYFGDLSPRQLSRRVLALEEQVDDLAETSRTPHQIQLLELTRDAVKPLFAQMIQNRAQTAAVLKKSQAFYDHLIQKLELQITAAQDVDAEQRALRPVIVRLNTLRNEVCQQSYSVADTSALDALSTCLDDTLGKLVIEGVGISESKLLPLLGALKNGFKAAADERQYRAVPSSAASSSRPNGVLPLSGLDRRSISSDGGPEDRSMISRTLSMDSMTDLDDGDLASNSDPNLAPKARTPEPSSSSAPLARRRRRHRRTLRRLLPEAGALPRSTELQRRSTLTVSR